MPDSDDILIKVDNVSKKFCRDFKKSLWYGVTDTAADLFRFRRGGADAELRSENEEVRIQGTQDSLTSAGGDQGILNSKFSPLNSTLPELRKGEFWANQNISFSVRRGECLGLIGHNGAGKTTLLKMLNGLIKPDTGSITMKGRIGALIALGAGFNPILTGRENIYVNGSILGLSRREIDEKLEEIIDFAEIEEAIDAPVRTYSSGMQVRLGFAVAAVLTQPDILILDEVLAVGDASFRAKCFGRISDLLGSTAVILVSHNIESITRICDQALYLKQGEVAAKGMTHEAVSVYLSSVPGESSINVEDGHQFNEINVSPKAIAMGDSLRVKIDVSCPEHCSYDDCLVKINFTQPGGGIVAEFSSLNAKARIDLAGGSNSVCVQIPSVALLPATYEVTFSIIHNRSRHLFWGRSVASVKIKGVEQGHQAYQLMGQAEVKLPVHSR